MTIWIHLKGFFSPKDEGLWKYGIWEVERATFLTILLAVIWSPCEFFLHLVKRWQKFIPWDALSTLLLSEILQIIWCFSNKLPSTFFPPQKSQNVFFTLSSKYKSQKYWFGIDSFSNQNSKFCSNMAFLFPSPPPLFFASWPVICIKVQENLKF